MISDWKSTNDVSLPLVKIGTQNDSEPPLIIEHPDHFPFEPGEREQYRVATDEEYRRYVDHYNAIDNADGIELWEPIPASRPQEESP